MTDPRENLAAFSERVLRRPLWPHQLAAADTDAFVTVIAAARRTGKTTLSEDLAIYTALRERNVIVLILSATEDAARRVTEGIGETLARSQLLRGSVVEGWARRIELTNGSKIVSLPASQRQVRGYGKRVRPVDPVVAAGQFLSATHGYVLLEIAGTFGHQGHGLQILASLARNLMVGLGDSPEAVERSLLTAAAASSEAHDARIRLATPRAILAG